MKTGVFVTKIHIIQATVVLLYLTTIDKFGLLHIGFRGDWKVYLLSGLIYYMRDHEFRLRYSPFDMNGLLLILKDLRIKQNEINKTIVLQYYGSFKLSTKGDLLDNIICNTLS